MYNYYSAFYMRIMKYNELVENDYYQQIHLKKSLWMIIIEIL